MIPNTTAATNAHSCFGILEIQRTKGAVITNVRKIGIAKTEYPRRVILTITQSD